MRSVDAAGLDYPAPARLARESKNEPEAHHGPDLEALQRDCRRHPIVSLGQQELPKETPGSTKWQFPVDVQA